MLVSTRFQMRSGFTFSMLALAFVLLGCGGSSRGLDPELATRASEFMRAAAARDSQRVQQLAVDERALESVQWFWKYDSTLLQQASDYGLHPSSVMRQQDTTSIRWPVSNERNAKVLSLLAVRQSTGWRMVSLVVVPQ